MSWIAVTLEDDEKAALRELAKQEKREPKLQAALLIRQGLETLGLLPAQSTTKIEVQNERS